jgi:hypothetical protein
MRAGGFLLRFFALCLILIPGMCLPAQPLMIRGRIIDKITKEPVAAATITTRDLNRTISDAEGRFALGVQKFPVVLSVSHVSYGNTSVTLTKPAAEVIISLQANINPIPEVRISASRNRLQILNNKARYTIIDYQFEDPYLWFIGCLDNSPKGSRLYLGYPSGDTVCSVSVAGDVRLYRDVFDKIHLVRPDTVYQLFTDGDSIRFVYPERTGKFMNLMNAWEVAFGDGLARLDYDARDDELYLVYKDTTLKEPRRLFLFSKEDKSYLEKKYAWMGRYFGPRTLNLIISQQKDYYLAKMRSSMFTFRDTLFVMNLNDNQLHVLGRDLTEMRVVPVTFFFRQTDDITNEYMPFRIITDRVKRRVYIVFHLNSHYTITPFNTLTGLTGPPLVLPVTAPWTRFPFTTTPFITFILKRYFLITSGFSGWN